MCSHIVTSWMRAREPISFLRMSGERREAAQKPIVAIYRMVERKNRSRDRVDVLLEKTAKKDSRSVAGSFGTWATARLGKILKRFFKASPSDLNDLRNLHRFRIRGKELRYAMELLAPAFAGEFREELYPVVEELQERLGLLHDHVVAKTRFRRWINETKSKRELVHLQKLFEQEHGKLDQLLRDFASWWTPRLKASLQSSFQRLSSHLSQDNLQRENIR